MRPTYDGASFGGDDFFGVLLLVYDIVFLLFHAKMYFKKAFLKKGKCSSQSLSSMRLKPCNTLCSKACDDNELYRRCCQL